MVDLTVALAGAVKFTYTSAPYTVQILFDIPYTAAFRSFDFRRLSDFIQCQLISMFYQVGLTLKTTDHRRSPQITADTAQKDGNITLK